MYILTITMFLRTHLHIHITAMLIFAFLYILITTIVIYTHTLITTILIYMHPRAQVDGGGVQATGGADHACSQGPRRPHARPRGKQLQFPVLLTCFPV